MKFAIIGFGAAGTFAALQLRRALSEKGRSIHEDQIFILEKNRQGLRKVKISGGGRCNVTHHQFQIKLFTKNYPRGERELIGPFHQFSAEDTVAWFEEHGVELKTEDDGRMFPKSNKSQTIIDCFSRALEKSKIEVLFQQRITSIEKDYTSGFAIEFEEEPSLFVDSIMIATGSDPSGYALVKSLGHTITDLAPSLFTFKINDPLLKDLAGTSFTQVQVTLKGLKSKWQQDGPLLITHWGLSGPSILKLSAWAAREIKDVNYKFEIRINFLNRTLSEIRKLVEDVQTKNPKKLCLNTSLEGLTKKFWRNFLEQISINYPKIKDKTWQELSLKEKEYMLERLYSYPLRIVGQNRFKEEFVECGGVSLKEIDFKTMESKSISGLFFGGELIDIDGITGGFNFQNAWTTGYIAGENMAKKV